MQRRKLVQALLGIGAAVTTGTGTGAAAARERDNSRLWLHDTRIAGSSHYAYDRIQSGIRRGDTLDLVRESENRYDTLAVELYWKGYKLGYLPRTDNTAVASLMDRGYRIHARVIERYGPERFWEPLDIRLWLNERNRSLQ